MLSPSTIRNVELVGIAEAYDAWFRAKIEKALADPRASIPHEVVMAQVQAILDRSKKQD